MDGLQSKSEKKRHRKSDKTSHHKKQRHEPAGDADQEMKITDLNDHCLIKLFEYLDIDSLLNVTVACNHLIPTSADVFHRRYGRKEIVFNECDDFRPNTCDDDYIIRSAKERNTSLTISGLKTSLLYLRTFGASIQNLTIDYYKSSSIRYAFVHQYISKYCTKRLIRISLMRLPSIAIEHFEKPFMNVRTVNISDSDLGKQLASCRKWLPNMRHLQLKNVRLNADFDRTTFRHLKHLSVCVDIQFGLKALDISLLLQ